MASNRAGWGPGSRGLHYRDKRHLALLGSGGFDPRAVLHVRRAKKGTPATHPIVGDEMRALRKLQREQDPKSPFVFTSERGSPFTTAGLVERAAWPGNGIDNVSRLGFSQSPKLWSRQGVAPVHEPVYSAVHEAPATAMAADNNRVLIARCS